MKDKITQGDFYMGECQPYITLQTVDFNFVMPAMGWAWLEVEI